MRHDLANRFLTEESCSPSVPDTPQKGLGHHAWCPTQQQRSRPTGHGQAHGETRPDVSPGIPRAVHIGLLDQSLLVGHFANPRIEDRVQRRITPGSIRPAAAPSANSFAA